jgi:hypothetical protein
MTALGIPLSAVHAYQLLYTSTNQQGQPVVDVTTILIPTKPAPSTGRPLVSYQVAEDALTENCAPSYELQVGDEDEEPLIGAALGQGWAVVVPDYEGENSEWTAGIQAGNGDNGVYGGLWRRQSGGFLPSGT